MVPPPVLTALVYSPSPLPFAVFHTSIIYAFSITSVTLYIIPYIFGYPTLFDLSIYSIYPFSNMHYSYISAAFLAIASTVVGQDLFDAIQTPQRDEVLPAGKPYDLVWNPLDVKGTATIQLQHGLFCPPRKEALKNIAY